MEIGHWIYNDNIDTNKYVGFIYEVVNTITNQKYVGKKNFCVKGESVHAWKNYQSSSTYLKKDIKKIGKSHFEFRILELHKTNIELSQREIQIQVDKGVLTKLLPNGLNEYYNRNIHGVGFNGTGTIRTEKVKNKQSQSAIGNKIYHNPLTGESLRIRDSDKVPNGFIKGMLSKSKETMSMSRSGTSAYYNPNKLGEIYLKDQDIIPDGYIKGTNPLSKRNQKGENGNCADHTIYLFEHTITNERFKGTQINFRNYTNVSPCQCSALISGRILTTKKWKLLSFDA